MSSLKLDINQLLKDTNLTQEALDTIVEKCLRKSCEEIVARAKSDHPSWKSRNGGAGLEKAIMSQVHKRKRTAYVYVRQSELTKNSKGDKVPYHEYLRFGTGLYGKHSSYIYPRNSKRMVWEDNGRKIVAKKTRGIKGDDWLTRARESVDINKIFREVLAEYYGSANVK